MKAAPLMLTCENGFYGSAKWRIPLPPALEKAIRADPVGTGSKLLGKVFGAALGQ